MRPASITITHNQDTLRGRGFVANLEPPDWEGYTHEKRDIGGFWAMSHNLVRPRDELMEMFENGLDREVVVTAKSGTEIWEGYIDELALQIRGVELRKSLNRMANSVWVRYASGGVSGIRGTVYNDAASQAKYGIKCRPFSGGQAVGAGQANQAAQVLLARLKSPDNPSIRWVGGGQDKDKISLAIRCKGWWHKFYWQPYNQTVLTGTAAAYAIIGRILDALESTAVVNNCLNPSFELNVTDDWTFWQAGAGGSANLDATQYYVGAKSVRIRAGNNYQLLTCIAGVSVPNGATVTVSGWFRSSASFGAGTKVTYAIHDSTNNVARMYCQPAVTANTWIYCYGSWTNTTGLAATCLLRCWNEYADSATDFWFDACQLEVGGPASLYTDGTLPNCGWSGAAHNSTSWRKTLGFVKNRAIQRNDTTCQEKYDADMWPADIMKGIAGIGDSNFGKWIVGMRERKTVYYEPAAPSRPA